METLSVQNNSTEDPILDKMAYMDRRDLNCHLVTLMEFQESVDQERQETLWDFVDHQVGHVEHRQTEEQFTKVRLHLSEYCEINTIICKWISVTHKTFHQVLHNPGWKFFVWTIVVAPSQFWNLRILKYGLDFRKHETKWRGNSTNYVIVVDLMMTKTIATIVMLVIMILW